MKTIIVFILTFFSLIAAGDEAAIKAKLTPIIANIGNATINKTAIDGLYEVILGAKIFYVSSDAKFLIQGEIRNLNTGKNITGARIKQLIVSQLNTIPEADKIIFKAANETDFVHVFTDVDCPYCQKLHREIPALNKLGVTVKYLASPIASLHPKALQRMKNIWCSKDRKAALDKYKKTKKYSEKSCPSVAVERQLALSQLLGVNGTPSIFLSNGTNIPGFVAAKTLHRYVRQAR